MKNKIIKIKIKNKIKNKEKQEKIKYFRQSDNQIR